MRKVQKQEVLEMIQTLHQAHDEVKNYIDRKNYVLAQDILSQCQECAISIGTLIEKIEGERFVTVSYVENYCDVLFSVYEELNGTDANANKAYKNLKKQLLRIENSVKNDVPVRKEIAFFPYKASMWDALESVYLAAKEDPNCDAYCVPIPYYDRNPDRSLGEMHYEGREYPKNIEVIDWQTYNFEERKPDVVYIHNPYDDWNLVTCVHPRYFSANLKKYTEELVYIPYFVLDEIEPTDQASIDGMKHFCFLPGVVNADKVIVQSEKMKQIYVNEYLKAAQAHGLGGYHLDRKKLEEKFLGLGSPKLDKVKNTKKEDLEIPAEWLKIIEKPDGSWKKIIFYNTSIAALLEHNEKMLEKMKDVFKVFQENRDEVALLWRPHPLIKSTVSSMRPQLWVEYEKLVNQYQQEGWGIYDDSSDMDRAVILSDAYYGDASSVVQVYQQTGKPVMIQNVCADNLRHEMLSLFNFIVVQGEMYFNGMHDQFLYRYNIDENMIEEVSVLSEKGGNACLVSSEYVYYKQCIYIFPYHGDRIIIYNIDTKRIEYLYDSKIVNAEIKKAILHDEKIFLLSMDLDKSFILNLSDNTIVNLNGYKNVFLGSEEANIYFHRDVCVRNNSLFVPGGEKGTVVEYNMNTNSIIKHQLRTKTRYATIAFDGGFFWLTGDDSFITRWDGNEEESYIKFEQLNYKKGKGNFLEYFSHSVILKNNIYFFPINGNMILRYNLNSQEVSKFMDVNIECICWCAKKIAETKLYIEVDNNNFVSCKKEIVDVVTGKTDIVLEYDSNLKEYTDLYLQNTIYENDEFDTTEYLRVITHS